MEYLPCAFEFSDPPKQNCVNLRHGHAKGHQNAEGVIHKGENNGAYIPSCSGDELVEFRRGFKERLNRFWQEACKRPDFAAPKVHETTLRSFLETEKRILESFRSRRTCFRCLARLPEHALTCGHVFCDRCIRVAGECVGGGFYDLRSCPLGQHVKFTRPCFASIKPPGAGVRIMSLDG